MRASWYTVRTTSYESDVVVCLFVVDESTPLPCALNYPQVKVECADGSMRRFRHTEPLSLASLTAAVLRHARTEARSTACGCRFHWRDADGDWICCSSGAEFAEALGCRATAGDVLRLRTF